MTQASEQGARLVQFTEGALSGYVKAQIKGWDSVDWAVVTDELAAVAAHARFLGLWTVVGCNHQPASEEQPHNSLFVISDQGEIFARYDKRVLSHTEAVDWYIPGDPKPITFEVESYRFGLALCIEVHFPELFQAYEQLGVDGVLLSAYSDDPIFGIEAQAHAATNCIWVSVTTPALCSPSLSSRLIGPNGRVIAQGPEDGKPTVTSGVLDRAAPELAVALTKARAWRAGVRRGRVFEPLRAVSHLTERTLDQVRSA